MTGAQHSPLHPALTRRGERGTAAEQLANLREACAALKPRVAD